MKIEILKRKMTFKDSQKLKSFDVVVKKARQRAKAINFLFIYNGSAFGLAPVIKETWSEEEMEDYIKTFRSKDGAILELKTDKNGKVDLPLTVATGIRFSFFETYSIEPFMETLIQNAKEKGYVENFIGARRHLPTFLYKGQDFDSKEYAGLASIATNAPILMYEAVYMYQRMIELDKKFKENNLESKLIYMVHDSIGGYVKKEEKKIVFEILKEVMEDYQYDIPFTAEVVYGDAFGFGKEITKIEDI